MAGCGQKLTQADVLKKASEAIDTVDSYSIESTVKMTMTDMEMTMDLSGDITKDPQAMYMKMGIAMAGMSMDMETYVLENEAYMSMFGQWVKATPEELELDGMDQFNKDEIEKLNNFKDYYEMKEEGSNYVLTLKGEGEKFNELVKSFLQQTEVTGESEIADFKVNSLDLVVQIDKKSYAIVSEKVKAELEYEGEVMKMEAETKFTNVNKVEPIQVPDDVKESAVTVEE